LWFGESGRITAKPMGGDHNSRLKGERAWLLERIAAVPDLTLEEIRAELAERGIPVALPERRPYRTLEASRARCHIKSDS
jgi:transposase